MSYKKAFSSKKDEKQEQKKAQFVTALQKQQTNSFEPEDLEDPKARLQVLCDVQLYNFLAFEKSFEDEEQKVQQLHLLQKQIPTFKQMVYQYSKENSMTECKLLDADEVTNRMIYAFLIQRFFTKCIFKKDSMGIFYPQFSQFVKSRCETIANTNSAKFEVFQELTFFTYKRGQENDAGMSVKMFGDTKLTWFYNKGLGIWSPRKQNIGFNSFSINSGLGLIAYLALSDFLGVMAPFDDEPSQVSLFEWFNNVEQNFGPKPNYKGL